MKKALKLWFAGRIKNSKITIEVLDELIARKLAPKFNGEFPLCYCRKCGANGRETFEYAKSIIKVSVLLGIFKKLPLDSPENMRKKYIVLNNCNLCHKKNEPQGVRIQTKTF